MLGRFDKSKKSGWGGMNNRESDHGGCRVEMQYIISLGTSDCEGAYNYNCIRTTYVEFRENHRH